MLEKIRIRSIPLFVNKRNFLAKKVLLFFFGLKTIQAYTHNQWLYWMKGLLQLLGHVLSPSVSPLGRFFFSFFLCLYMMNLFSRSIAHVLLLLLLYTRIEPRTKWLLLLGAVIISSLCVAAKTDGWSWIKSVIGLSFFFFPSSCIARCIFHVTFHFVSFPIPALKLVSLS